MVVVVVASMMGHAVAATLRMCAVVAGCCVMDVREYFSKQIKGRCRMLEGYVRRQKWGPHGAVANDAYHPTTKLRCRARFLITGLYTSTFSFACVREGNKQFACLHKQPTRHTLLAALPSNIRGSSFASIFAALLPSMPPGGDPVACLFRADADMA